MQATTYQAAPEASLKPADKAQLAKARYEKHAVAEPFRRAIVDYHRKEAPGSIVVDSDNHYLYYVQPGGKAIRYGITVGEEAMAWSGIAKVGSKGRQGRIITSGPSLLDAEISALDEAGLRQALSKRVRIEAIGFG